MMRRREADAPQGRLRLPTLVAGLTIGALVAGGLVPLVRDPEIVATAGSPTDDLADAGSSTTTAVAAVGGPVAEPGPGGPAPEAGVDGGAPGAPEARRASDVGVTADTITVGALTLDCKACASVGVDVSDRGSEIVQVFVDDLNRRGGVHGRKLDLAVHSYDPVGDGVSGSNGERAACIDLTEKDRVFAAMYQGGNSPECLYDEHQTPTIAGRVPIEDAAGWDRVGGRVWSLSPSDRRSLVSFADQATASGLLRNDQPFGVVTLIPAGQRDPLLDRLAELGFPPAHVSHVPNDAAAAPAAIATESAAMRRKGVQTVLLRAFAIAGPWVQEAERNDWRPRYVAGDFGAPVDSTEMPDSFVGATVISDTMPWSAAPNPAGRRCLDLWQAHTGESSTKPSEISFVYHWCDAVSALELALEGAGTNPTRQSLLRGLAAIGDFPSATSPSGSCRFGGAFAFGPVKWSCADSFVVKRWNGAGYSFVSGPTAMST